MINPNQVSSRRECFFFLFLADAAVQTVFKIALALLVNLKQKRVKYFHENYKNNLAQIYKLQ